MKEVRVLLTDGDVITTRGTDECMEEFKQDVREWLRLPGDQVPTFVKVGRGAYVPLSDVKMVIFNLDKE